MNFPRYVHNHFRELAGDRIYLRLRIHRRYQISSAQLVHQTQPALVSHIQNLHVHLPALNRLTSSLYIPSSMINFLVIVYM
ncbi:hypothetical protein ACFXTO_027770 [Malus domestica]